MNVKKFIDTVKSSLGIKDSKNNGKKKSMRNLLKKLDNKKDELDKSLKSKKVKESKKTKKELQEKREIVLAQIKKGKKILEKLNS